MPSTVERGTAMGTVQGVFVLVVVLLLAASAGVVHEGSVAGSGGSAPVNGAAADVVSQASSGFTVDSFEAPESVIDGQQFEVSAVVENTGDETMTRTVEYRLEADGTTFVRRQPVTLDPGQRRTVTVVVDSWSADAGEYEHGLFTPSDGVTGTLEVTPVTFEVSDLQGPPDRVLAELDDPDRATQGDVITVTGLITNTDEEAGTQEVTVTFRPSGEMSETFEFRDRRSVALEAGESRRVNFDIPLPNDLEPGLYRYRMTTEGDSASRSVTIDGTPVRESGFDFADRTPLEQRVPLGVEASVQFNVANPTDSGVTGLVDFQIDTNQDGVVTENETIERRLATLSPGLNEDEVIRYTLPEETEPGVYRAEVVYGDASQETFLYVYDPEAPAQFVVTTGRVDPIEPGETYRAGSTVLNGGGVDGNVTVELRVDLDRDGELTADEVVVTDRSPVPIEPGEAFSPTLDWDVPANLKPGEIRYGIFADGANTTMTTEVTGPESKTTFQLDLVEGEPIEQFDPDEGRTYHKQNRFVNGKFVTEDEATYLGPDTPHVYRTGECVLEYGGFGFQPDTGEASTVVELRETENCESLAVTLAGYELPEGETGWNPDRIEDQELRAAGTLTLEPGERVELVIDLST